MHHTILLPITRNIILVDAEIFLNNNSIIYIINFSHFFEATPPLRKAGIGYRYGFITKNIIFSSQYEKEGKDINHSTGEIEGVNSYVYSDSLVSNTSSLRSPVTIQFP